jgi:hypothetical protein
MADVRISNLPTYTADTTGAYLVMNDSGNTTTYKVLKEDIVSGGGLTYNELTRIPQDMVWDALAQLGGGGEKVAGGLIYNYTTTNLTITTGTTYGNTIIMEPGDILDTIEFPIDSFSTEGSMNIGLYSIVESSTTTGAKAYAVGDLLHTITTGYTISSSGDKVITSINYTAQQGETLNNVYFVAFQIVEAGYVLEKLQSNNQIAHIGGGANSGGIYYRSYFNNIGSTGSELPADFSSYTISTNTSPGMYFSYITI